MRAALVVTAMSGALGCTLPGGGAGDRPEGFRLVTGTLDLQGDDTIGRQTTGLQIAGIAIDGDGGVAAFPSDTFDGSRPLTSRFTAPVEGTRSFVLVLQVPSPSTTGPGGLVAVLHAPGGHGDGTLLPPGTDDINLGTVTLEVGARVVSNELIVGDANNPLAQIDTDGDGVVDLSDDDDDDDGTPDVADPDVGGDGIEDAEQTLAALPDTDNDGTPDVLDP